MAPQTAVQSDAIAAARAALQAAEVDAATVAAQSSDSDLVSGSMGPLCWAAIVESMSSYARRCLKGEPSQFRTALGVEGGKIDRKLVEAGWSAERLAAFKQQMGEAGTPDIAFCGNRDVQRFYAVFEQAGAVELRKTTVRLIAVPGPPEWGTCL